MGFFDKLKKAAPAKQAPAKPAAVACTPQPMTVLCPVAGEAVALADAPDPVFAEGMLGQGIVIRPSGGVVYAPVDGELTAMMGSGHAAGLKSPDGVEVLIHVGVDTVEMKGEGFTMWAKQGDQVKAGQPIISFDSAKIKAAGHPDEVMVLISNTAEYDAVEPVAPGPVSVGQPVITVR
ncbi:PTS glucose transporter subunit IIA [Olsenella sp. YH-ols2217]|uniref:PTS glucose transporter subunit IIA n=1 Tax=Kribbibacterium absianum TaxID=3044210 RepID=A0ABT6ZLJ7_9ACTN|nr:MULTISPECIES: PTS glucose transporter subunit IIA [unclassified Olsenella]MDJ1121913.1 PTS glucose transporter subunit IIA [Olsenella sp. YH-ols2216]MDJ1129921.1 PTS glucose transporter subunit IIA [Olsenella sp. YH-ols2217]